MDRLRIKLVVLAGLAGLLGFALWPTRGEGQGGRPGQPDRLRKLERDVDLLKSQVKQLNATMDQLTELMARLNNAVRDPQVQKQLAELRAARQPATTGKIRKLSDLSENERAEITALKGQIKISTNPVEDQGRLVSRLWDFCVYDVTAREMNKLLKAEHKAKGDRWRQIVSDRLNREFNRFEKPDIVEAFLRIVLDYPLIQGNEKGLAWINSCAGVCRQLYTADPNRFKSYLSRAIKLYEASIKLNPGQVEVKSALKALRQAKADAQKQP